MLSSIILEIAVKDDEKSKTDCLGLLKSNEQGSFVNGLSHELIKFETDRQIQDTVGT
jgi:hypothetical protein